MTEEMEYKRGFNQGYLIRKHRPDLDVFSQLKPGDVFSHGLLDGRNQYDQERQREQLRDKFKTRGRSQNRSQER